MVMNNEILKQSEKHMKNKWKIMRGIKINYDDDDMKNRMFLTTNNLVKQGCHNFRTFIDVDNIVGLKPLEISLEIKDYWKKKNINMQIGTQLLEGLENDNNIYLFNKASELVDFIGCLPSRDKNPNNHLDIVFSKAKQLNKDVEAHLDQCNIPTEKETELFCDFVEKYNYQGKARAIHCVSLSCHPIDYQIMICKRLKSLDIGVIVCPSAAISMIQESKYNCPIHNSLAPVNLLIKNNVNVGLGIDNIEDVFMPFCDGDLKFELRLLSESQRIYNPKTLTNICNNNMGFNQ
tara:strand:- start:102 stop:974 length:873 start_codon:yes stop_codon:yes gene_type:complete